MNDIDIVNKILLAGGKIMPEIHLKQPGFILPLLVDHLQKTKKKFKNFSGDTNQIYKSELD